MSRASYRPKQLIRPGYYVYEHWRSDQDQPFYVGAGIRGRAWDFAPSMRNDRHRRIVHELRALGIAPEVRIIEQGLTKGVAHRREDALIKRWRKSGIDLANANDLADANMRRSAKLKGRVFSAETRKKMRLAKLGKKQSLRHVTNRAAGLMGHPVSTETRLKISIKRRAYFARQDAKRVSPSASPVSLRQGDGLGETDEAQAPEVDGN